MGSHIKKGYAMNLLKQKDVSEKLKTAKQEIKQNNLKQKKIGLGGGLFLLVRNNSVTYWARIKANNKDTSLCIGNYEQMKLTTAYNQAKIFADKAKNDILEQKKTPLFKDYWVKWRAESDKNLNLSIARIRNKNAYYNGVLHIFDDYRIDEITPLLVNELTANIQTSKRNLKNCLNTLITCLEQARLDGIIQHNDLIGYTRQPKFNDRNLNISEPSKPFKWLDIKQLKEKLFSPLDDYPLSYKVYILLVLFTVSRGGEIRKLRWDHIHSESMENCEHGFILIPNNETKTRRDTEHLDHIIPLTPYLKKLLKKYKEITQCMESPFLFPSKTNPNKEISASLMLLPPNITEYLNIHGLRKTANTFLVSQKFEMNFNEKDIDKILSHKTDDKIHITYNKYDYLKEFSILLNFYNDYLVQNCLTESFKKLIEE